LSDSDILQAERSLYRIRQDLILKQEELTRVSNSGSNSPSRGWAGRVFGSKVDQGALANNIICMSIPAELIIYRSRFHSNGVERFASHRAPNCAVSFCHESPQGKLGSAMARTHRLMLLSGVKSLARRFEAKSTIWLDTCLQFIVPHVF
jgi:hypothetical protein